MVRTSVLLCSYFATWADPYYIMIDQIMTSVNEIDYYMGCQQREQKRKLTGRLPIVAEYLETRMGTSAVTSMLALNEYGGALILGLKRR